jgi:hypothetical protein
MMSDLLNLFKINTGPPRCSFDDPQASSSGSRTRKRPMLPSACAPASSRKSSEVRLCRTEHPRDRLCARVHTPTSSCRCRLVRLVEDSDAADPTRCWLGCMGGRKATMSECGTRHSPLEPIAVHSGKRSQTELPLGLSLHQSPSGPSGVGVFFNEIGGWFGFADRIVFATQVLWPGIRPPQAMKMRRGLTKT